MRVLLTAGVKPNRSPVIRAMATVNERTRTSGWRSNAIRAWPTDKNIWRQITWLTCDGKLFVWEGQLGKNGKGGLRHYKLQLCNRLSPLPFIGIRGLLGLLLLSLQGMHQMNTRALARRTEMRGVGYNRAAAQRCGNNSSRWWMECDPILERTS